MIPENSNEETDAAARQHHPQDPVVILARKLERERNQYRHALQLIANTDSNPEGWASDAQIARHYLSENVNVLAKPTLNSTNTQNGQ